jgi:hypothetical protein
MSKSLNLQNVVLLVDELVQHEHIPVEMVPAGLGGADMASLLGCCFTTMACVNFFDCKNKTFWLDIWESTRATGTM